jgi:hypothetical protein
VTGCATIARIWISHLGRNAIGVRCRPRSKINTLAIITTITTHRIATSLRKKRTFLHYKTLHVWTSLPPKKRIINKKKKFWLVVNIVDVNRHHKKQRLESRCRVWALLWSDIIVMKIIPHNKYHFCYSEQRQGTILRWLHVGEHRLEIFWRAAEGNLLGSLCDTVVDGRNGKDYRKDHPLSDQVVSFIIAILRKVLKNQ